MRTGSSRRTGCRTALVAGLSTILLLGCTAGADDGAPAEEEAAAAPGAGRTFVSRPDLTAPEIEVTRYATPAPADGGLFFLGTKGEDAPHVGPLVVDAEGEPVWIGTSEGPAYDVRAQTYRGEPVLTWWEGDLPDVGYGYGEVVIADSTYTEVARVTTTGDVAADIHETVLTDRGTALLLSYPLVRRDLSGIEDAEGEPGPEDGWVLDGVVEEVDVETGESLMRWSALDHVPLEDAILEIRETMDGSREKPWDYVHVNSVTEDGEDALLVSARSTSAVYRLDRTTGEVLWTLGGKSSDYDMADGAEFGWQHDAQRQDDGTLTLFDNVESDEKDGARSRGLRLELDEAALEARVVDEILPMDERLAPTQGNMQVLSDGGAVIGWGKRPSYTQYAADGTPVLDARIVGGQSYRAYRLPWTATPADPPAVVVDDDPEGRRAFVSWNGATEVVAWRFLAGDDVDSAQPVATVQRRGFETSAAVPDTGYLAVEALDAAGAVLATGTPD